MELLLAFMDWLCGVSDTRYVGFLEFTFGGMEGLR